MLAMINFSVHQNYYMLQILLGHLTHGAIYLGINLLGY